MNDRQVVLAVDELGSSWFRGVPTLAGPRRHKRVAYRTRKTMDEVLQGEDDFCGLDRSYGDGMDEFYGGTGGPGKWGS